MKIYIKKELYENIINHCLRKLSLDFYDDETKEQQAFGGIIGKKDGDDYIVTKVINWKKNYRFSDNVSKKMNTLINQYAIPGDLDVKERAWAVDPLELCKTLNLLENEEELIGTYHMHHDNSWKGEYPRELASELDRQLSAGSEILNFIVYIGQYEKKIRAFYESKLESEYEIEII